jgi:hypothetical protein
VTVNCTVDPCTIDGLAGLIVSDVSVAAETVTAQETGVRLPEVAAIVVVPKPTAVASPDASMVTMVASSEPQLTKFVTSCKLLSLKTPTAENCRVLPLAKLCESALMSIASRAGTIVT